MLEPLERTISDVLIPALLEHQVAKTECDLLALPVRMGGLGLVNPVSQSQNEYEVSIKGTAPLWNRLGTFRLDYEYEIEYEHDFSILVFMLHIITTHTHLIP